MHGTAQLCMRATVPLCMRVTAPLDMHVTEPLCRASKRFWFKKLWKVKGVMRIPPPHIPKVLLEKGVKIEDPKDVITSVLPENEKWSPPVPDDPRWCVDAKPETEHPDYHEEPIYRFSNRSRLLEGEQQAAVLTKTRIVPGLPDKIHSLLGVVTMPDQDELVQRYIMQANKWDPTKAKLPKRFNPQIPGWKFKREFGTPWQKRVSILIQDLLRLCYMTSGQYPEVLSTRHHSQNHFLSFNYHLPEEDKHVEITGDQEMLVTSNKPLTAFADEEAVDATVTQPLPDMFPIMPTIDLKKHHIYNLQNNTGWQSAFSHIHPHTLWISDTSYWSTTQRNAKSLMFCFGHTAALAKKKYGEDVKNLPEPISMQCILSNGERFDFVCFQLNTLNMQNKEGIKNLMWHDCDNLLYNRIVPKRAMLRNTKYEDYDPLVLEKILAFYANGLDV